MNKTFEKYKRDLYNFKSLRSKVAYELGSLLVNDLKTCNPMIHYFEIKKHFFKKTLTISIYCERPGVIIGMSGITIEKLKSKLSEATNREIKIKLYEFTPVIWPIYDID